MWPRARSSSQMTSERALSSSTTSMRTELESAMTSAPPRLRSRHRQDQGQPRTLADLALDPDLAPVRGDDAVADGEAEAGALSDRLGGEERAEDLVQVLRWDAHAVVGDGEHHRVRSVAPRLEIDVPSGRCGVEGVHQEGDEGLTELAVVGPDVGQAAVELEGEAHLLQLHLVAHEVGRLLGQGVQVDDA